MDADFSDHNVTAVAGGRHAVTVNVNGEPTRTHAATLAELIDEAGYAQARIATALNGNFVAARARVDTPLSGGDHVEIVAPRQGG